MSDTSGEHSGREGGHPGRDFQAATRYERASLGGHRLDWNRRPPGFKTYEGVPTVPLPPPRIEEPGPALWEAVALRRSVRSFADEPLTLQELSQLLWASTGATHVAPNHLYRAAPSAGGLYPIETYVAVRAVRDLDAGLYHYRVAGVERDAGGPSERVYPAQGHVLERIGAHDISAPLAEAALDQGMVTRAPAVFIWTAVYERSRWKYRERAYRYVYLDAGHVAAQLSLAAVALGLGSCQIGAFFDSEVDSLLGIDGVNEGTVYLSAVGKPAHPPAEA